LQEVANKLKERRWTGNCWVLHYFIGRGNE